MKSGQQQVHFRAIFDPERCCFVVSIKKVLRFGVGIKSQLVVQTMTLEQYKGFVDNLSAEITICGDDKANATMMVAPGHLDGYREYLLKVWHGFVMWDSQPPSKYNRCKTHMEAYLEESRRPK